MSDSQPRQESEPTRSKPRTLAGVKLNSPWTVVGLALGVGFLVVPLIGNNYHLQIAFLMLTRGLGPEPTDGVRARGRRPPTRRRW